MKILVNKMPKKKEECFFYRKEIYYDRIMEEYCSLNNKTCSFKNNVLGGECRCLRVEGDADTWTKY